MEKKNPNPKKPKTHRPEAQFRHALDMCSKTGDLTTALSLYSSALSSNLHLSPYHYTTLLHLLSQSPSPSTVDSAFEIYAHMTSSGSTPTESTISTMARIAAQKSGDLAFELVKTMKEKYNLVPKLRTFAPAVFTFCNALEAEKAYEVEGCMNSVGVAMEEAEIAALLRVSAKTGRADRVYEYLLKLRSVVGYVGEETAGVLEEWFRGEAAAGFESGEWDAERVQEAVKRNGGGWHGLGWMGEGRWEVRRVGVGEGGECRGCGERLACVDIEERETEEFGEAVAGLAMEREAKSNFKKFQEWLENYAYYEAIVDGANIALYKQNFAEGGFSLSQLDTVVRKLYKRSQSKWPFVVLHNKRYQSLMENPSNRQLLDTWRAEGALYITPNGSNDDWYWLYAAVKLKCLLVTNDEMRDHIFELLGRSFFPKWKERHQVHYTFVKSDLKLMMPPPYSVVIQESETGAWHVPIADKNNDEKMRVWLCISRPRPGKNNKVDYPSGQLNCTIDTFQADKINGVKGLSPLESHNNKSMPSTGKRKERSPSPTKALAN